MPALRSIRLRLTLWYIGLLALILAAFSAGIYLTLREHLNTSLNESIETRSDELLAAVRFEGGSPTLAGTLPETNPDADEQFVRVYSASGEVTFDSSRVGRTPPDDDALRRSLAGETVTATTADGDGAFRSRFAPIRRDGALAGALEVARSDEDTRATLDTLLLILGLAYPATLALASLGGVFLARRALAPVDDLTRLARRLSAEDLSQRLELRLPDDEIGRLARTFNDMLDRLERSFRQQRQFTTDASHELRTPLTAIKGQVEVALSRERSTGDYREALQSVNDEMDRLIRLVNSLLSLARADAGEVPLAIEDVSVEELLRSAVEQVRPLAEANRLDLQLEPGPQASLRADQDLLLQLLLNLLDNAVKYTPAGGQIVAGWSATSDGIELRVCDTGRGIAPEHLSRVFDRFYRVDKARSRVDGGAGLGLSISHWIAEAHGGSIAVESTPGGGSVFTVRLPSARS